MRLDRYRFQINAADELRCAVARATRHYVSDKDSKHNYVISLQAPTGSGKTIIMASLIEDIYCGSTISRPDSDEETIMIPPQPEAIFVWLSDSPALNQQSMDKIDLKADKIRLEQCIPIQEDSFDMEMLEDGHIYFLNTQKLSVTGRLGIRSDDRQYTIWETLDNTAREKADHLYFIIDEAHRGMMQPASASTATTIMQRFIKGSPEHGMRRPMPVIIGMSATSARFERLVGNCSGSSLYHVKVPTERVRQSGLLKDRILVIYPEDIAKFNETAVLQAATKEWVKKCEHWGQFSREQHYKNVDPVFVIQVEKGSGKAVSKTDLSHVLKKACNELGIQGYTCGNIRKTYMTNVAQSIRNSGGSAVGLEQLFDHKNVETTFRAYAKITEEEILMTISSTKAVRPETKVKSHIKNGVEHDKTQLVSDGAGYCQKETCLIYGMADCFICPHFVTTLDFYDSFVLKREKMKHLLETEGFGEEIREGYLLILKHIDMYIAMMDDLRASD